MKFSAQEEYGLRCLLQIAREPTGTLTIPEIAGREALSDAYVAKLMRVLRKGGIVKSTRGQKGGYRLAKPAEVLSVGSILAALGGRLYSEGFCGHHTGTEGVCIHSVDCSIRSLLMSLDATLDRALSKIMLSDLLCGEQEMAARVDIQLDTRTMALLPGLARYS